MLKLYKEINGELHYWETWDNDDEKSATVHWGKVGERGENKEVKSGLFSNFRKEVQKEVTEKSQDNYYQIDEDDLKLLEVVYKVDGMGNEQDIKKRHEVEGHLNELLGWTGLGHVDGGSIGSGEMEVACFVVDFDIAKKVIENDLAKTKFSDFTKITNYEEE